MRGVVRDLIRGGHYGQRSCEPRLKAEHMGAPTNAAYVKKSPCQLGAVHTWGDSDLRSCRRRARREVADVEHLLQQFGFRQDGLRLRHYVRGRCHRCVFDADILHFRH
jgi:hypothetical protein